MKAISFSAVEILPSLLNLRARNLGEPLPYPDHPIKTQTIRPIPIRLYSMSKPWKEQFPSRYKVGDVCKLMWKQRTSPKDSWFCKTCGTLVEVFHNFALIRCDKCEDYIDKPFSKLITEVKLSEVFQIEMVKSGERGLNILKDGKEIKGATAEWSYLFQRDGFKTGCDFEDWFNEHYDLSTPKRFEVRRWQ